MNNKLRDDRKEQERFLAYLIGTILIGMVLVLALIVTKLSQ